jgi:hypothetical protein
MNIAVSPLTGQNSGATDASVVPPTDASAASVAHRATTCPCAPLLQRSNSQRQTRPSRSSLVSVAVTDMAQRTPRRAQPTDVSVALSTDVMQRLTLARSPSRTADATADRR